MVEGGGHKDKWGENEYEKHKGKVYLYEVCDY